MDVKQIIRASADVLTITSLRAGDVYKRVVDSAYGDNTATLRFGVVQDVMNNGTDAAVTAIEYTANPAYAAAGVTVETKVFTGSGPVAIFPATPEEVERHFSDIITTADLAVEKAREAHTRARETRAAAYRLREQVGVLTAPETTTEDILP